MKILLRLIIVLVVLVALLLVAVIFRGGDVVKQGVNRLGPQVLGVDVTLDDAQFHPLRGYILLNGLTIGNPEGFHTESLFAIRQLEVDVNMRSLLTDTIIIDKVLIDAPQITYEVGLRRTNLGALVEQLEARQQKQEATDDVPEELEPVLDEVGKTVIIKELVLADARAQVSATAARGRVVPIQLATITLNNLGGEDQSLTQIVTEVLKAVLGAVTNAVAGAGDLLGDGLTSALEGVGALGGRATEGARAVTGALGDGARGVRDRLRREENGEGDEATPEAMREQVDEVQERATEEIRGLRDRLRREDGTEADGAAPETLREEINEVQERATDAIRGLRGRLRSESVEEDSVAAPTEPAVE